MVNIMQSKTIQISLAIAVALCACGEPYTVDEHANDPPVVTDVIMRDGVASVASPALVSAELNAAIYVWEDGQEVFPFNFPYVRFNKLMDGYTIETVGKDKLTGRDLGNCGPTGNITMTADGANVSALRTCYSPSDLLVGVQPSRPTATDPFAAYPFLTYGARYTISLTSGITDKGGRALSPYSLSFNVRPFELLRATNAGRSAVIYGAAGTRFAASEIKTLSSASGAGSVVRLVFSGPVSVASLADARFKIGTSDVVQNDENGKPNYGKAARADPFGHFSAGRDPRVVYVMPPQYILSNGEAGLEPGDYSLVLPVFTDMATGARTGVSDDGTVTGSPVTLEQELRIDFKVN